MTWMRLGRMRMSKRKGERKGDRKRMGKKKRRVKTKSRKALTRKDRISSRVMRMTMTSRTTKIKMILCEYCLSSHTPTIINIR